MARQCRHLPPRISQPKTGRLSQGQIAVEQGIRGSLHGDIDELGHMNQYGADLVELVVVDVAHFPALRCFTHTLVRRVPAGWHLDECVRYDR